MTRAFLLVAGAAAAALSPAAALAWHTSSGCSWYYGCTTVAAPEIDATTGGLAVAIVGSLLLFVWERRRRSRAAQS